MPTYDVAAYQLPDSGSSYYTAALITSTSQGRLLSGPEKLAQRFLLELMTETGSLTFKPNRGCEFLTRILTRQIYNDAELINTFYIALTTITTNLQSEETASDPDNERFAKAELGSMTVSPGQLSLSVTVYSLTAEAIALSIPIAIYPKAYLFEID